MRRVDTIVQLWPAGVALLLAIGVAAIAQHGTRLQRLANADLHVEGIPETYIVPSRLEPGSCKLVGRRGATVHRSESGVGGRKWKCRRISASPTYARGDLWVLSAKRQGTGTVLFVPVEEVPDLRFPYLYEFVRARRAAQALPEIGWTQLFVSRIYQGLHLRVSLPFDRRKRDGGSGVRRELLTLREGQLSIVDTRFQEADDLYAARLRADSLPQLERSDELLIWLSQIRPTQELTLLLSNSEPHGLSPLPLPVSLPGLFARAQGYAPAEWPDPDLASSLPPIARSSSPPLAEPALEELRLGYERYSSALLAALASHVRLWGADESPKLATRLAKLPDDWLNATR